MAVKGNFQEKNFAQLPFSSYMTSYLLQQLLPFPSGKQVNKQTQKAANQ